MNLLLPSHRRNQHIGKEYQSVSVYLESQSGKLLHEVTDRQNIGPYLVKLLRAAFPPLKGARGGREGASCI
jgi:hypothetical protein